MSDAYVPEIDDAELQRMGLLGREVFELVQRSARLTYELHPSKAGLAVWLMLVHTCEPNWTREQVRERLHQLTEICLELRERGELAKLFEGMIK